MIRKQIKGFTLIELVMVIVILAILAAIGVPVFVDLSDDAKSSAMKGSVNSIRSALNVKIAENAAAGGAGGCPATLEGAIFANGKVPKNPMNNKRTVKATTSTCISSNPDLDDSTGWLYNSSACLVCPNTAGTDSITDEEWISF